MTRTQEGTNNAEGSIEIQIENFALRIENFALRVGVPAAEIAKRVAVLVLGSTFRPGLGPDVFLEPDSPVEPLALAGGAHSIEAPPAAKPKPRKAGLNQWSKMNPMERSQEMLKRFLKIKNKTPAVQKQIKTLRKKLRAVEPAPKAAPKPLKKDHGERDLKKQRIYQLRHEARKAGKPLPPLPKNR